MLIESTLMPSRSLSAPEAAARLGVKRETLYAYVSRGVLSRRVGADGKSSVFDAGEVEQLVGRRRRGRPPAASIDLTITSALTRITDEGVWYRGVSLRDIVGRWSFERTAEWLWSGGDGVDRPPSAEAHWPAARVPVPRGRGRRVDGLVALAAAVAMTSTEPRPEDAVASGRRLIAAFADRVPPPAGERAVAPMDRSIAARLTARLGGTLPAVTLAPLVDRVLVALADHELASSTLAARVAASTRADAHGVVVAGLGVLGGPLHGAASGEAVRFLRDCRSAGVRRTVDGLLATGRHIPAFGHTIYRGTDPRHALLAETFRSSSPELAAVMEVVDAAADVVGDAIGKYPNVDLSIAALTLGAGLAPDTGEVLFAVARTAGWIAHAIEEYGEAPVRFRPRSVYVGPIRRADHRPG